MKIISIELDEKNKIKALFHKGDTALRENMPIFLSEELKGLSYNIGFAIKTNRVGKYISPKFAHRYYSEYAYALDFRLLSREDLAEGSLSFSFDASSAFSSWTKISEGIEAASFYKNGDLLYDFHQNNLIKENTIFELFDDILSYFSRYYTIKIGDIFIIRLETANNPKLKIGDLLEIKKEQSKVLSVDIK